MFLDYSTKPAETMDVLPFDIRRYGLITGLVIFFTIGKNLFIHDLNYVLYSTSCYKGFVRHPKIVIM